MCLNTPAAFFSLRWVASVAIVQRLRLSGFGLSTAPGLGCTAHDNNPPKVASLDDAIEQLPAGALSVTKWAGNA
jgi:hypothetical protein